MGHGRKQKSEAVESHREAVAPQKKRDGRAGDEVSREEGQMMKEVAEMKFSWKSFQLLAGTEATQDVQQLFSVPAVFLLARLTSPWERKAVGCTVIENSMGSYKRKMELGREERLLEDKEKERMAERVWRIGKGKEKRQDCNRRHL